VSLAIKRLKHPSLAKLQYDPSPRYPVGAFTVNQMADDIERAPCVFAFISEGPGFWEMPQKRVESGGGTSEKRNRVLQIVFHHHQSKSVIS
jgi:hypothetical protein